MELRPGNLDFYLSPRLVREDTVDLFDERDVNKFIQACAMGDKESLLKIVDEVGRLIFLKVDSFGNTGLTIAAKAKQFSIVELLLEKGADVNCKNTDGLSAYTIVLGYLLEEFSVNYFFKNNYDREEFNTYVNCIEHMLLYGANFYESAQNKSCSSFLHLLLCLYEIDDYWFSSIERFFNFFKIEGKQIVDLKELDKGNLLLINSCEMISNGRASFQKIFKFISLLLDHDYEYVNTFERSSDNIYLDILMIKLFWKCIRKNSLQFNQNIFRKASKFRRYVIENEYTYNSSVGKYRAIFLKMLDSRHSGYVTPNDKKINEEKENIGQLSVIPNFLKRESFNNNEPFEKFFKACGLGDEKTILKMLNEEEKLLTFFPHFKGMGLKYAAIQGIISTVKILVNNGAFNSLDQYGNSSFCCILRDLAGFEAIVKNKTLDFSPYQNQFWRYVECLDLMLEYGADPYSAVEVEGRTDTTFIHLLVCLYTYTKEATSAQIWLSTIERCLFGRNKRVSINLKQLDPKSCIFHDCLECCHQSFSKMFKILSLFWRYDLHFGSEVIKQLPIDQGQYENFLMILFFQKCLVENSPEINREIFSDLTKVKAKLLENNIELTPTFMEYRQGLFNSNPDLSDSIQKNFLIFQSEFLKQVIVEIGGILSASSHSDNHLQNDFHGSKTISNDLLANSKSANSNSPSDNLSVYLNSGNLPGVSEKKIEPEKITLIFESLANLLFFQNLLGKYPQYLQSQMDNRLEIQLPENDSMTFSQARSLTGKYVRHLKKSEKDDSFNVPPLQVRSRESFDHSFLSFVNDRERPVKRERKIPHHLTSSKKDAVLGKLKEKKINQKNSKTFEAQTSIFPLPKNNEWKYRCLNIMLADPERDTFEPDIKERPSLEYTPSLEIETPTLEGGQFLQKKGKKDDSEKTKTSRKSRKEIAPFLQLTSSLSKEQVDHWKDRVTSAYKALEDIDSIGRKLSKLKFDHEDTFLTTVYQKALEYHLLRFCEAIFPTGREKQIQRAQGEPLFCYVNEHFFLVDSTNRIRNEIRSSFPLIDRFRLFEIAKRLHGHRLSFLLKNFIELKKNKGRLFPLDLSDIFLVPRNWEESLHQKEVKLVMKELVTKIIEAIQFIQKTIKPFKDRQYEFHFGSDEYLSATKKSLSDIAKLFSLLADELKKSPYLQSTKELIQLGNAIAHEIIEENDLGFSSDEIPIGKIWDLFREDSPFVKALLSDLSKAKFSLFV